MGVAYYGSGLLDLAIDAFLQTIVFDPSVEQPYLFLGRIVNKAGDRLPLITERFADYQQNNPRSYLGYFLHAKALAAQFKDPELAESLLRKSIALNGDYWESHFELGSLLDRKGALPEAEKEFRLSKELNPKDPNPYYRLSRVLAKLGRLDEARSEADLERKVSEASRAAVDQRLAGMTHLEISIRDPDQPKQPK
jgi:tetratricopeptide (TPR) repeat protein